MIECECPPEGHMDGCSNDFLVRARGRLKRKCSACHRMIAVRASGGFYRHQTVEPRGNSAVGFKGLVYVPCDGVPT